jgi:adenosylmethionine-8-amino-7-oxononanoate aminotransferase
MSTPPSAPSARARADFDARFGTERSKELSEKDRRYLWHPFTQMAEWLETEPLVIERAEGCALYDVEGKRYLDGVSSLWVTVHGHRKRAIDRAVKAQLDRVAHTTLLGLSNVPSIELGERLVAMAPSGLTRVFYSDSGSTAVEIALKIAFQYRQQRGETARTRFVHFTNAYHGDTIGSVSVGGIDLFHALYKPLLFHGFEVPAPHGWRCPDDLDEAACGRSSLAALEATLRDHAGEIAAAIVEPVMQGAAGMIPQPPGWLAEVRRLCTRYGVLLIADEVATGFGRTGTMFACEQEGVSPDLLCLAKGITGGYLPLAATLATEEIFRAFLGRYDEFKAFFHGHTYTGNPLACAAALASLDLFEKERTLEKLRGKILRLSRRLAEIAKLPHVGDVRQRGFMAGIELAADVPARTAYPVAERRGHHVCMEARRRGAILRPLGDVVVLMPPLGISTRELDQLCDIARDSIAAVCGA